MKKTVFVLLILIVPSVYGQNLYELQGSWSDSQPIIAYAKVGLGTLEVGGSGLVIAAGVERSFDTGFRAGFSFSNLHVNNFPEFFTNENVQSNGVPPAVEDYLLTLNAWEAIEFTWRTYNIDQLHFYLNYDWQIKPLRLSIIPQVGVFGSRFVYNLFYINETVNDAQTGPDAPISDFTPIYQVGSRASLGWSMGVSIQKAFNRKLLVGLGSNIDIPFDRDRYLIGFLVYSASVAYRFELK